MRRMIKRMAEKKVNKLAKAMGIDGLGKDGAIGAVFCVCWMVIMWTLCVAFSN